MTPRPGEQGMALVTVLLMVAVAAAALAIMMSGEDAALQRATRMGDAARARAIAQAGELSVIAALRRDKDVESDNATEPWATIADKGSPIPGGKFQLVVADAQGKLNLTPLMNGDQLVKQRLATLATALRLPDGAAERIARRIAVGGPISDMAELREIGLSQPEIARLAAVATFLPFPVTVNLNAAPEALLGLLTGDPVAARALAARRARAGKLSLEDFAFERTPQPPGSGFVSRFFWVSTRVTISGTAQQVTTLLLRRPGKDGTEVVAIARWRGGSAPVQAPTITDANQ
jgi:general secretion pathway protein K